MDSVLPLAIAAVTGILALVTQNVIIRRSKSGKINTSEASDLWAESKSIREEYKAELKAARDENIALRVRVSELERRISELETTLSRRKGS